MPEAEVPGPHSEHSDTSTDPQHTYFRAVRRTLSAERWQAYRRLATDDDYVTGGRYAWNLALSEALYPALHTLEIALRNAIFDAVAGAYPVTRYVEINCWLDAVPSLLLPQDRARVHTAKRTLRRALHRKFATKALVKAHMTPGRLVAELSIGFWTYLFGPGYAAARTRPGRLWPQLLETVLPGLPPGTQRAEIARRLNGVRELRNRVFHHETIWNRTNLLAEYDGIMELNGWLCPEVTRTVAALDRFRAVHADGISRFLRRRVFELASAV